jgi:hypothetical protein
LFRDVAERGENLESKIVAGIMGMAGGVLLIVGTVAPWISSSIGTTSGIDFLILSEGQAEMFSPVLLLVGGILVLVGGVGKLAEKKAVGYLMPIGTILALAGWVWALRIIIATIADSMVTDYISYGISVGLVGIILAGLGSLLPRKQAETSPRPVQATISEVSV